MKLLSENPRIERAILFGSRAKGNYREGSDIDIAIQGARILGADRTDLLVKYEGLNLPWKLDIVLYDQSDSEALKEHIDRVGVDLL